jgi:vacuolar-type H+-ATPase subunit E/Vma4
LVKDSKEELLDSLWYATIEEILKRVKSGKAKPTDISNAVKMLRDNDITVDPKGKGKDFLDQLEEELPDELLGYERFN